LKEEECGVWERIIKKLFPRWKFELHSPTQQIIVEKWIVFYTKNLSIKLRLVMYIPQRNSSPLGQKIELKKMWPNLLSPNYSNKWNEVCLQKESNEERC
jgi:hypothetical protein